VKDMDSWVRSTDKPVPIDRGFIGITGHEEVNGIFIAKFRAIHPELKVNIFQTAAGTDITYAIDWWHEIPELPHIPFYVEGCEKEVNSYSHDGWFGCELSPPPRDEFASYFLILIDYDKEMLVTEADYWCGGYSTDFFSCNVDFNHPLFWRPFPRLPIHSERILQV
jgi:hypothetical protein